MSSTVQNSQDPAIVGLGMTEVGKVYGRTATQFAADAVQRALADAGLRLPDVDGLLVSSGMDGTVSLGLARDLGVKDLTLLSDVQSYGATAGALVQHAALAIRAGMAETVVCVWADAPLQKDVATGAAYTRSKQMDAWKTLTAVGGFAGANSMYALAARRHMDAFGTTSEQFGHIAVAQRQWAAMNPKAQMREPITLADHQASRMICDPFHLLDCCLVSNGGAAVVVTSAERAADLSQPPVHVLGGAQSHPNYEMTQGGQFGLSTGASVAGPAAMKMAGVSAKDVDVAELYDCFTFTVLITLEDYGFCAKGEGGEFVSSGALAPGGALPTNTGGGQLSSYYLWGMTPLSEGIIQARGQGGERQAPKHDVVLVSGNGGFLEHHSTLVLSPHPHS